MQQILETANCVVAWPFVTRVWEGIKRDQVDLARHILEKCDHFLSVFGFIVHILEQGVFDSQHTLLAETRNIALAGGQ
ncbi:hypothetical protein D3C84_1137140 [compost metagenome]